MKLFIFTSVLAGVYAKSTKSSKGCEVDICDCNNCFCNNCFSYWYTCLDLLAPAPTNSCPICSALFSAFESCNYGGDPSGYQGDDVQGACFCEAAEPFLTSGSGFTESDCVNSLGILLGDSDSPGGLRRLQQQEGLRSLKSKGKAKAKGSKGKPKGNKSKEGQLDYGRFWSDVGQTLLDPELRELWRVIYLGVTIQAIKWGDDTLSSA
ncbi:hypothetical protein ScalyP_jg2191 [Parmales sp. scaly parma]|nr:hypothetical protein ScalyP_jg2191 [Parmales sp. scaly parma]